MYGEQDRKMIMSWLEGLSHDDWRENYSDKEVQAVAQEALSLLKEYSAIILCMNCKHGVICANRANSWCNKYKHVTNAYGFCSDAE